MTEKRVSNLTAGTKLKNYRASGLVYAREGVLLAGCKSLPELATAP